MPSRQTGGPARTAMARGLPAVLAPVMLVLASRAVHAMPLERPGSGHVSRLSARAVGLGAAMALIVAAIAGLAYWDAARESAAALQDFADEQAVLARAASQ